MRQTQKRSSRILYKIEAKLESFKDVIVYKVEKLKKKLSYFALKKYLMETHTIGKILIGISIVGVTTICVFLGYELVAGIILLA